MLGRVSQSNGPAWPGFHSGAGLTGPVLDPTRAGPAVLDPAVLDPTRAGPAVLDPAVRCATERTSELDARTVPRPTAAG